MKKEIISDRQGISLIILYLTGNSSIMALGVSAKEDLWLVIILAVAMGGLISLLLIRLHKLFPGKNLFDICEICFGSVFGKLFVILISFYTLHTGAIVLRNDIQFINITGLTKTPLEVIFVSFGLLLLFAVKGGIEVLGRWSEYFVPIFIIFIFTVILLLLPQMDFKNVKPTLYNGITPVLKASYLSFTFPFGELGIFIMAFAHFKTKKSYFNIYITGLLIGGFIIFLSSLTNVLVLGVNGTANTYYPAYLAVSRLDIGKIINNLEMISASAFILGGFVKISIYLLGACKGVSKIFNFSDYRFVVTPVSIIMSIISFSLYDSVKEFNEWDLEVWPYYALMFQIIIPVVILIAAEIKVKVTKKTAF